MAYLGKKPTINLNRENDSVNDSDIVDGAISSDKIQYFRDDDDMTSAFSNVSVASQESIKTYVDTQDTLLDTRIENLDTTIGNLKTYVDTQDTLLDTTIDVVESKVVRLDTSGNLNSDLTCNGYHITDLADCTADWDAAPKAYVDNKKLQYIRLHDLKAVGLDGGTSNGSGIWDKRIVIKSDDSMNLCTINSSGIVLTAGIYDCLISCPAARATFHQARLRNTTDNTTILVGSNESVGTASTVQTNSIIRGRFTIGSGKNIQIQHLLITSYPTYSWSLGYASSFVEDRENEIYTIAEFWKID